MEFNYAWQPQVCGLSKPYRTALCNAGDEPFVLPNWPRSRCEKLMNNLAALCTDHALAGFVVSISKFDFADAVENGPKIRKLIDSPYTLCVEDVVSRVSSWVSESVPGAQADCGFEEGAYHETEARAHLGRLSSNPDTKADFSSINDGSGNRRLPFRHSVALTYWLGSGNGMLASLQIDGPHE